MEKREDNEEIIWKPIHEVERFTRFLFHICKWKNRNETSGTEEGKWDYEITEKWSNWMLISIALGGYMGNIWWAGIWQELNWFGSKARTLWFNYGSMGLSIWVVTPWRGRVDGRQGMRQGGKQGSSLSFSASLLFFWVNIRLTWRLFNGVNMRKKCDAIGEAVVV